MSPPVVDTGKLFSAFDNLPRGLAAGLAGAMAGKLPERYHFVQRGAGYELRNQSVEKLLGYRAGEALGRRCRDLLRGRDLKRTVTCGVHSSVGA